MTSPMNWQKYSYSGPEGDCLEVAALGPVVALRESDDPGVVLTTTPAALDGLIRTVKASPFGRRRRTER